MKFEVFFWWKFGPGLQECFCFGRVFGGEGHFVVGMLFNESDVVGSEVSRVVVGVWVEY